MLEFHWGPPANVEVAWQSPVPYPWGCTPAFRSCSTFSRDFCETTWGKPALGCAPVAVSVSVFLVAIFGMFQSLFILFSN